MNLCTKSSLKDARDSPASFEPTFVAIGKTLDLSDKIYTGGIFGVDFDKNQKNVKMFPKKTFSLQVPGYMYTVLYC